MHLTITNVNETYIKVHCDESVAWELRDAFSFRPPGFQFVPSYRQKLWDGYLRLFNPLNRQIYRGLAPQVIEWAENHGYTFEYQGEEYDTSFSLEEANEFVERLNPKHPPRDYQLNAFVHAIRSTRRIVLSPTGSGKSLLLYMVCNYLLKQGKRGLLIVPRSALVEQMYSDFEDYSSKNGKDMSKYCHRVYSDRKSTRLTPVTATSRMPSSA